MGTETKNLADNYCCTHLVKLNNPLMGTETIFCIVAYLTLLVYRVKLNNPLMGTETYNHNQKYL